mmetsp:Transcript_28713/g.80828  ORF Transcript_28713/g.80828 Transcript_28713/m.80828 type:complete len:271 (+) Transcript_28713:148-960(+)
MPWRCLPSCSRGHRCEAAICPGDDAPQDIAVPLLLGEVVPHVVHRRERLVLSHALAVQSPGPCRVGHPIVLRVERQEVKLHGWHLARHRLSHAEVLAGHPHPGVEAAGCVRISIELRLDLRELRVLRHLGQHCGWDNEVGEEGKRPQDPVDRKARHSLQGEHGRQQHAADKLAIAPRLVQHCYGKAAAHGDPAGKHREVLEGVPLWYLLPSELKDIIHEVVEGVEVPSKATVALRPTVALRVNAADRVSGLVPVLHPGAFVDLGLPGALA